MNKHDPEVGRRVKLFRNGRNQAVRIPVEYELPGDEATIRKVGDTLIIAPQRSGNWIEALRKLGPLGPHDQFPDIDDSDLLPVDEVIL